MSQPTTTSPRAAFLPAPVSAFFRRRLAEGVGLALLALGVALAFALASYAPGDPSFNNAAAGPATNLMGQPGAFAADLLLQTFGLAGALPLLVLTAWAWRIGTHRGLSKLWLRIVVLPAALVAAAAFAASFPASGTWPLATGYGGWFGHVLLLRTAESLATLDLAASHLALLPWVLNGVFAILGGVLLILSLGLTSAEWRGIGIGLLHLGHWVWLAVRSAATAVRWITRFASSARQATPAEAARAEPHLDAPPQKIEPTLYGEAEAMPGTDAARVRVAKPAARPRAGKRAQAEAQPALDLTPGEYRLPTLNLLARPPNKAGSSRVNAEALEQNARLLEAVLDDFGVRGQITNVRPGPVVALYELEPAPGTKTSRVISLADDIARSMSVLSVRAAVVPGRNAIGIEVPNAQRETVYLRELLASTDYENTLAKLALALGKDLGGTPLITDLARMPHLLIAGTTGSGKSVGVNAMILSLLYRMSPDQCKLILIDPKRLELSVYDGIPHLLTPVVVDPAKAVLALKWTVQEMENRYRAMSHLGVRNITGYNQRLADARTRGEALRRTVQTGFDPDTGQPMFEDESLDLEPMPYVVLVVDEMADLMLLAGKEIEGAVQRLSQMARAAGIHIIMATQRPSVDVITGTIKANFPTRISFQVTSKIDSRTILGEQGAEQLLGSGDMLFMQSGGRLTRVHGPFVSVEEVESVVQFLKTQGRPDYLDAVTAEPDTPFETSSGPADELYDQAMALVCNERRASTSFIQRHLQIGYNRAARIIERMEAEGVVTPANHVGKREVLARSFDSTV